MARNQRKALADILLAVDERAAEMAATDEPEAIEELRRRFRGLAEGDPSARYDAYGDLAARFCDGHVSVTIVVPFLVDLAESLDEPTRCAALALLVALGHSAVDSGDAPSEVDAAFASVVLRLDALSGWLGLSPRLAKRAARRARGKRYELADILGGLEKVENVLAEQAAAHARQAREASLTPDALTAAARAAVIHDARTAASAITLARQCSNVGRPEDVLSLCDKLGEWRVGAEPARIRALIRLGRVAEAREATIALVTEWLAPATSIRSVNQVLQKSDIKDLLRDVKRAFGGNDIEELARAVDRAEVETFIEMGTDSF
jgi:hypothetical protein